MSTAAMTREHTDLPDDAGTHRPLRGRRLVWVALALLVQIALVAVAVAPQLSARVTGQEYRLTVAPVDPIDPFRGAYVTLGYPGLVPPQTRDVPPPSTRVYVPLVPDTAKGAQDVWKGGAPQADPPSGPYLRCEDQGFRYRCGIESWFAPQERAAQLERDVRGGQLIAVIRVDDSGNAAIVDLQPAAPKSG